MLNLFSEIIEKESIIASHDKILLGVSGGIDSMVMFDILYRLKYDISIAHCNFSLRGEDSIKDMELVERVAKSRGVTIHKIIFDTEKQMLLRGLSLQQTARELRYEWFQSLVEDYGFNRVAIAHNQDDNIETFFINMVRGTGIRGLLGIPVTNKHIVRPLMSLSRNDIIKYAKQYEVEYRDDKSNATTKYLRNKIRHEIVPRFRECSDNFDMTMIENMNKLSDSVGFIDSMIEQISLKSIYTYDEHIDIDLDLIGSYTYANYILFEMLRKWDFSFDTAQTILKSYSQNFSGKWFYSKSYKALLNRNMLSVYIIDFEIVSNELMFSKTSNKVTFNDREFILEIKSINDIYSIKTDGNCAVLDFDKLNETLLIRYWKSGDEFIPFGMKGRKKLSDFFVDNKLSLVQKDYTPIIFSGDNVVWVAGMRIDDRFKVDKATKNVLCLRLF